MIYTKKKQKRQKNLLTKQIYTRTEFALTLMALVLALLILLVTLFPKCKVNALEQIVNIRATVAPHYEMQIVDGTINLTTNMKLKVNNKLINLGIGEVKP